MSIPMILIRILHIAFRKTRYIVRDLTTGNGAITCQGCVPSARILRLWSSSPGQMDGIQGWKLLRLSLGR